jgi:hypothetical protein
VTIKSADSWSFDNMFEKNTLPIPTWLTASTISGAAGETIVTFHADAVEGGREAALCIRAGSNKQFLTIRQGSLEAAKVTIAEALNGTMGRTYRINGTISGTYSNYEKYGNFYVTDETGTILVYGIADKDGKQANEPIKSWGIEVGDDITIDAALSEYKGTPQLTNGTVIELKKGLVKLPLLSEATVTPDAQILEVTVAYKGSGVYPTIPESAKSWIKYEGTSFVPGVKTIFETNPADTAVVKFSVSDNIGATRMAAIDFVSSKGDNTSFVTFTLTQNGMAKGDGTASDPFNVVALTDFASKLGQGETADKEVYVTAKISQIDTEFSSAYGNATY